MASDDDGALIARLRDAFAENIKSRSEAANTRKDIAAKVNSHLKYDGDSEDFPSRVVPRGNEITGLRRRYLEVLKTNIEARERYQLARLWTEQQHNPTPQGLSSQPDSVISHLERLQLHSRHQELETRHRYVNTLSQDALKLCNMDISPSKQYNVFNGDGTIDQETASSIARVEMLNSKLRKTLLQANHRLERQKVLLAEAKQSHTRLSRETNQPADRPRAIAVTRDALVAWLDDKLSASGADQVEELSNLNGDSKRESDQSGPSIAEQYQSYLLTRKEAIEAAHEAMRPLARPPSNGPDETVIASTAQPPTMDYLYLVYSIKQRLVPLLQQHFDSMTLKQYSLAQSAKERQDTLEVLERLADESHLLCTYPASNFDKADELERNVAAWVSAAKASSASVTKAIDLQCKDSLRALEKGEEDLADLNSYQDNHKTRPKEAEGLNWHGIHGNLESSKLL